MKKGYSVLLAFTLMFTLSQAASAKSSTPESAICTVDAYYNDLATKNFAAIADLISDQSPLSPYIQDVLVYLSDMFYQGQIDVVNYKVKKVEVDPANPNYLDASVKLVETEAGHKTISVEQVILNQDTDGVWRIINASVLRQLKK